MWRVVIVLAGCSYNPHGAAAVEAGAPIDVPPPPDAAVCTALTAECATPDVLRECKVIDELPVDTTCTWGCLPSPARCGRLHPNGGAVNPSDLDAPPSSMDITLANTVIDGSTGAITVAGTGTVVRAAGNGVISDIDFQVRAGVGVFRFKSLTITGPTVLGGAQPIALVAFETIAIAGAVDAHAECPRAGAGGHPGGAPRTASTNAT